MSNLININTGEINPNFMYEDDIYINSSNLVNVIKEYQDALETWVLLCQKYEKQLKQNIIEKDKLTKELTLIKNKLDNLLNVNTIKNNISYEELIPSENDLIEGPAKKKRKLNKPNSFNEYVLSTFK